MSEDLKKYIKTLIEEKLKSLIGKMDSKPQIKEQDYHPNPMATSGSREGFAGMAAFPVASDYDQYGNLLDDVDV